MATVVVAGGMGIAGTAVGSGLTYWLGVLNRRHQEAKEKETRWHVSQFNAYVELSRAAFERRLVEASPEPLARQRFVHSLTGALGAIRLVGSDATAEVAEKLYYEIGQTLRKDKEPDEHRLYSVLDEFTAAARRDLGYQSQAERQEGGEAQEG